MIYLSLQADINHFLEPTEDELHDLAREQPSGKKKRPFFKGISLF